MKIHVAVRCKAGAICSRSFKIAVNPDRAGQRIRVYCPSCMAPHVLRVPEPTEENLRSEGDEDLDVIDQIEEAVSDFFEEVTQKTGEVLRAILPK